MAKLLADLRSFILGMLAGIASNSLFFLWLKWFGHVTALLITTFVLAGAVAVLPPRKKEKPPEPGVESPPGLPQMKTTNSRFFLRMQFVSRSIKARVVAIAKWKLWMIAVFLVLWLSDLTPFLIGETVEVWLFGPPAQEKMVQEAAAAFDDAKCDEANCEEAIDKAKRVIDKYEYSAASEENALAGVPPPPIGTVSSGEAEQIFKRGSLNSVAYSWWIAGRSYEKLQSYCDAATAYQSAARLTHARTWDPQGWPLRGWSPRGTFWSPPDDAKYRIESTLEQCKKKDGQNE